jgi:hypothetical protein
VDSPLNSLEVFVSNFDGLNVTKATWIPLKVILPKQATWYQFVVLAVWTYLLTRENIAFRYTGSGKPCFGRSFQVDDVQVLGSVFKNKNSFVICFAKLVIFLP